MLKYLGVLIAVQDIAASRHFYEDCLGQKVVLDLGVNVGFEGGFAIHLKSHFQDLLGGGEHFEALTKSHAGELYFETDELEAVEQRLTTAGAEFVHAIREQPWGQRVMRLYDPDGHIVEIGETMEAVVLRFHKLGLSPESINQKTGMPLPFVVGAIDAGVLGLQPLLF
jgi:catechol 2,3-dioxygenase-like lactoylglutathione lyase family enzyme